MQKVARNIKKSCQKAAELLWKALSVITGSEPGGTWVS